MHDTRVSESATDSLLADTLLILALFAVLLAYLFTVVPEFFSESQGGDFPYYVQMAHEPVASSVPSPWRYRLLNPWLASWLMAAGVETNTAFLALTVTFAFASCVLMRMYLRRLGLSAFAARAGALLFAASVGGFIPMRRYYGYTDALMNAFTLLILMTAASRRYAAATVALGTGTVGKESTLLLLPFLGERIGRVRRHWTAAAVVLAVPLAVFVTLRFFVAPDLTGTASVALTWEAQREYWRTAMVNGPVRWILWAVAYSMGPVWLLALAAAPRNWRFIRASLLFLLPILVPLLRTTDTERALMLAFPVVFPLAASALGSWQGTRHAGPVAALAILCTWLAQLTFGWSPDGGTAIARAKDLAFIALCVLPLAPWLLRPDRVNAVPGVAWP